MPRKTDSEMEQWVLRELSLSKKVCSPEICVLACDGVVSLRGSARSNKDKLAIEEATLRATGVVGVMNEMRVKPSTALIEKVPLIQSPNRAVLSQPKAIQRSVVKTAAV